ncbi:hypothetical protein [Pyrobaculum aerophilum]|uniref:Uncharacterized protein n=2 Tax=Pyrobaculum aerophilum TaxID=13773 RepID=Q8ZYK8_PYRAE|nr:MULTISPECIES: hypothetical protein [Pyrobaculum]AAL62985.1 hypothetical protein PAE0730 [Pyrobaculum aerophilum str. IM2]MCX8137429.1 hypothetical protein [Pyrobaculum aerophilum]RFA92346.1 hypothetical protein CGL51_14520 [Pyrobaculum aerophilum]RFA94565.1 hypothetical protein CGL52_14225 [Pyrobaculum aerophilum]HII46101.1 hypothetical protein [Pyrobaculum aerophilum]
MSEELTLLVRRRGLLIKKALIKHNGRAVGEYIYVKRGLFEAEAEFDLEDGVLYYLQICWFRRCSVWFDGEPDRPPAAALIKKALAILSEMASFSEAAKAALRAVASWKSRSSQFRTSDLTHRLV